MESIIKKLGKASITVEKDYHSSEKEYNKLTIVEEQGAFKTYLSRKPVPVGIELTNREYWIPFSGVLESITLDYLKFKKDYASGKAIEDNAIITRHILNRNIERIKIALKAISEEEIDDNAIIERTIKDRNVTSNKIAKENILTEHLAKKSIITDILTDYSVTAIKLADNSVTTRSIVNENVTQEKLSIDIQSLISNLSKTATFSGIATPTTNPGIPTAKTFYIANDKGIYNYFNNIEIIDDEVAILYFDTTWHKKTTEIASKKTLTNLKEKVDSLALGTFYGFYPDSSSLPIDIITSGYAYIGLDTPYKIWNFNGESWFDSGTSIDMNDSDEEDLTRNTDGKLQFKDRSYGDGMGYVILRKNKPFAEQITNSNTVYEIRYDFNLNNTEVQIPQNCILQFKGGSLKNGTLIGNNTIIAAHRIKIFNTDIQITGTWNISCIYPEWFGAKNDGVTDSTNSIQKAIDFAHNIAGCEIKLSAGKYLISSTLYLYRRVSIIGCGVHSQTLNQQMNTATQVVCKFNNYNSWCFDTYGQGTLAEHNDIFFLNNERNSNYERNEGICLKGFSIVCPRKNPVYGAIRLWNALQGIIENISIYGTIFGISITESWAMHIKDCFIGTYRYGIGFGEYNTTNTVTNIYLSRHRWELPIDFDLPIVDNDFYPPYIAKNVNGVYEELTDTIKKEFSSAFFFSASGYGTRICIISPTIEFYECAFCGSSYAGEIINPYIEGFAEESLDSRTKYIAWIGGTIRTQLSLLIFGYAGTATKIEKTKYTYGSRSTIICVKGSFFGSCYTPTDNFDPMSDTERYIFESPFNTSLPYYDDYDENNLENSIKCPMKKLVGYDRIFASNSGTASNINNIAIERNNRVPLHEALKRCVELHINKISLVSSVILEKPINTIKNTYIEFYSTYINKPAKIQIENYPLKIDNSDLYFIATDTRVVLSSSKIVDYAIEVKGVCNIKAIGKINNSYAGISSTSIQHLLHIVGDSDITITCESQDDLTYRLSDDRLLFDRNVPYKYSIKVYHKNGLFLKELCNYKGTTTNRPNFTGVQGSEGFEYYDSDLKKKILWNSTDWINLDGTVL